MSLVEFGWESRAGRVLVGRVWLGECGRESVAGRVWLGEWGWESVAGRVGLGECG